MLITMKMKDNEGCCCGQGGVDEVVVDLDGRTESIPMVETGWHGCGVKRHKACATSYSLERFQG